jgi:integrase
MRHRQKYTLLPVATKDGNTVFYVRFYDPRTGRRTKVSTGESTIGRARTFADNFLADETGVSPRLEEYAADFFKWGKCSWIKTQHAMKRPFSEYHAKARRGHLDRYILPTFGKKRLAELTRPAIRDWLVTLPLSNQTKNHILYTFKILLQEAEAEKLIRSDPLATAKRFGSDVRARDIFTMDDLRLLFPKAHKKLLEVWKTEKYAAIFMVMATTGIRSGEARALAWRHLLPGGWLHVERAVKRNGEIGTTKTGTVRVIALPARTREELARWREESPFKEPNHLIFYGADSDTPLHVETLTHFFPGALVRAKVKTAGKNLVVHSLRHGYNTIMRQVLPEEILRRFTGHKTPEMTDAYDHPALLDQIKKLEGARGIVEAVWK